jgi:hypothetical protein
MCNTPAFLNLQLCNVLERGCIHDSPKSQGVTDQAVSNALTF